MLQRDYTNIIGYEDIYQISNDGHVLRKDTGQILSGSTKKGSYVSVTLSDGGYSKKYLIHRLVAQHFILQKNEYQNIVNHKDGIKDNNDVDNLEWCTPLENIQHAWRELGLIGHNKGKTGKDCYHSKKVIQLDIDGIFLNTWNSTMDVYRELGIHASSISAVCRGKRRTAGGYKWEYFNI